MNYKVKTIPYFDKQVKLLARKYKSFKNDLCQLINSLEENPRQGTPIGNDCYKIRVAIKSKGKGKSGGARAITHVVAIKEDVYLLSVYDKSEQEDIPDHVLKELVKSIQN